MEKYQGKLRNIWKTFDTSKPDEELDEFLREYHPSVMGMKGRVYGEMDKLNRAIKLFKDAEYRKEWIEDTIYRLMSITGWKDFVVGERKNEESSLKQKILHTKEFLEDDICESMFGIWSVEWNKKPKEIEDVHSGFLKRKVEEWGLDEDGCRTREDDVFVDAYDARVLDKWWDELWEYDRPVDEFWIPKKWTQEYSRKDDKLKFLIWEDYVDKWDFEKDGLRNQLADDFRNLKSIIPDDFIEELHRREEQTKKKIKKYKLEEAKHPDGESSYNPPYFIHHSQYHTKTWDIEFVSEDLWGDMDFEEIFLKVKKRIEEEKASKIITLDIGTLNQKTRNRGFIDLKDDVAAQVEVYLSYEDLKNNYNRVDGGVYPHWGYKNPSSNEIEYIFFIPEWGRAEKNIEEFLTKSYWTHCARNQFKKDIYFYVRWIKNGRVQVTNQETKDVISNECGGKEIQFTFTDKDKESFFVYEWKSEKLTELE